MQLRLAWIGCAKRGESGDDVRAGMSSSLDQIVAGVKYPPAPACGPGRVVGTRGEDGGRPGAPSGTAPRRECPPVPAAAGPAPQHRAPGGDAGGSRAPGAARRASPRLAACPARRPARDAAPLASRRIPRALAPEVAPGAGSPAAPGRERRPAPAHSGREPALGGPGGSAGNSGSWSCASPSRRSRHTCPPPVPRAREIWACDFPRSPTCVSARSSPSSSSR